MLGRPGQHLVIPQLLDGATADLVPGAGGGDSRDFPTAQRVRRDRGLGRVVLTPVQEHLPGAQASGHGGGDQIGHALLKLLGDPAGEQCGTGAADRFGECGVEVHALATTGERIEAQPDVVHQFAHRECHLAQLRHAHALAGVEVEHQSVGRTRLAFGGKAPLRHMHFQRTLLGDPRQRRRGVDDRVDGGPGPVLQGPAGQPRRCRTGEFLLEERRLVHSVGPALAGGRAAGDVRQHHVGDGRVIAEDLRFDGGLGAGGCRIEHLVRIRQFHQRTRRRTRRPHVDHRVNVLPAANLGQ